MATVSDNLTLSNIAELTDLEEQIEALQSAKREFYTAVRDEHGKTYASGLKSAIKISRMDSAKRAAQDETDAETARILTLIDGPRAPRATPAIASGVPTEQFDPETGEITESPPEVTAPVQTSSAGHEGDNSSATIPTPDGGGDTTEPDSGLGLDLGTEVASFPDATDLTDKTAAGTQPAAAPLAFLPTPKPLRPHCQHPDDLSQCPGQGAKHCYACRKAAWHEGREAA